jgi:hypothetical protein
MRRALAFGKTIVQWALRGVSFPSGVRAHADSWSNAPLPVNQGDLVDGNL